jgi:hypothetical protein
MNRSRVVSIAIGYGLDDLGVGVRVQVGLTISFLTNVEQCPYVLFASGIQPFVFAYYQM